MDRKNLPRISQHPGEWEDSFGYGAIQRLKWNPAFFFWPPSSLAQFLNGENPPFCLRQSPDHGTVDVLVVLLLLLFLGGTTLIFAFFQDTEIFIK